MRILINDHSLETENYKRIFAQYGYEENELIFSDSYLSTSEIIAQHLEGNKLHIDLIITNDDNEDEEILQPHRLQYLIHSIHSSFSNRNFRISSIPIILYSKHDTKNVWIADFNAIIKKNTEGNHDYFVDQCERIIKNWRISVLQDLDSLGLKPSQCSKDFYKSKYYQNTYKREISANYLGYYANRTSVLSQEFIKLPSTLNYDWFSLSPQSIEHSISKFIDTYTNHQPYDRKNGERAILHQFFNDHPIILLRDTYVDLEYEKNLNELNSKESEECDYILKTEYPEFLKTTFFEVKKEDVKFYVKKNTKRPQISSNFLAHLQQVQGYYKFTKNSVNQIELEKKLEYSTSNFDFKLLAGRMEEKEEMNEHFAKHTEKWFPNIEVITYEELENVNIDYLNKFNRLKVD
jgi:hypothetical protein